MTGTVSTFTMIIMCFVLACIFLIPIGLFIYMRKAHGCSGRSFLLGFIAFFLGAVCLEQIVHLIVYTSPAGNVLNNHLWMNALYGGLAAGFFEEGARFVTMKFLMKKDQGNDFNALMYGAGHGAFEIVYVLLPSMLASIAYANTINSGDLSKLTQGLSGSDLESAYTVLQQLVDTPWWMYMLSLLERVSAYIIQLSLSVIVWKGAVKEDKTKWMWLAMVIHMGVDFLSVILIHYLPVSLTEVILFACALLIARYAHGIWKSYHQEKESFHA